MKRAFFDTSKFLLHTVMRNRMMMLMMMTMMMTVMRKRPSLFEAGLYGYEYGYAMPVQSEVQKGRDAP